MTTTEENEITAFNELIINETARNEKVGTTWITLWGEGERTVLDMLEMAGPFIGRAKLAYGSSLLTKPELLRKIVGHLNDADVVTYPGGTVLEMALRKNSFDKFLGWAKAVGFTGIEVCDGVIPMDDALRHECIERSREAGFSVNTVVQEVVRKPIVEVVTLAERIQRAKDDLAAGADQVHIVFQAMARGETPADVVGPIKRDHAHALIEAVGLDNLVFEAMSADEQLYYLRLLGPKVNLGHVDPRQLILLEAQRRGLGYETFWTEVWKREHWS